MENLARKIFYSFFTIFLALTAIFIAVRLTPGDPVARILGENASTIEITKYREQLGLNLPVYQQYWNYLSGLVRGDLGVSLFKKKPVSSLLLEHMTPTIILALMSIILSTLIGSVSGILAGRNKSKPFDTSSRVISLVALSFPIFSLAPILVFIFSIQLNWLPVSEWLTPLHIILPIATLTIPLSAIVMRVTRNKFLEEASAPWVQTLVSKGMDEKGILLRLTKISLPTILNVVAIQLSVVLAGTMVTESIFDIPGVGLLMFESIQNRDYPVTQGIIAYSTICYMAIYFLIDFINQKIDTRISKA